eukprot:PITA_11973
MVEGKQLIIVLSVDDLILTGDDQLIMSCKEDLAREFEMKDMGLMHYFLGMEVWQKDGEVFVSQGKFVLCGEPTESSYGSAYQAVLEGSEACFEIPQRHISYGLWYKRSKGVKLQGFTDVDWAGSPSNRKSTSLGIFNLGSATVYWYIRKQRSVALSLAEAEYMVASQVACEAIWM